MEYKDEFMRQQRIRLRELTQRLPDFCGQYFRGIENRTGIRTRVGYAYDLAVFFDYLIKHHPAFQKEMSQVTVEDLKEVTLNDLEMFLEYVRYYENAQGEEHLNADATVKRKICALHSFYHYMCKKELLDNDPSSLLDTPKIREHEIIRLEPHEAANLLDKVETGEELTKKQKDFHDKTGVRDLAIMTLLLGTGIRVSELVGLNLDDFDREEGCVHVYRKGGKEQAVYFGSEVENAVEAYKKERKKFNPLKGHEEALFLSLQGKRISVRSVELLVKKYAGSVTKKKITPHKLRSTYGTMLYRETEDIYLVAGVLGHNDVNTTRKHYAALEQDLRRSAKNKVVLRDPGPKKKEDETEED